MKLYDKIHELIGKGAIRSAYALDGKGLAAAVSKMAFGNKLGVTIADDVTAETLFAPGFGNIVAEVKEEFLPIIKEASGVVVGEVNDAQKFVYKEMSLSMEEAIAAWTGTLERVFPTRATEDKEKVQTYTIQRTSMYAETKSQSRPYSFRYSLEQTVSTTVRKRLSVQVPIQL